MPQRGLSYQMMPLKQCQNSHAKMTFHMILIMLAAVRLNEAFVLDEGEIIVPHSGRGKITIKKSYSEHCWDPFDAIILIFFRKKWCRANAVL